MQPDKRQHAGRQPVQGVGRQVQHPQGGDVQAVVVFVRFTTSISYPDGVVVQQQRVQGLQVPHNRRNTRQAAVGHVQVGDG